MPCTVSKSFCGVISGQLHAAPPPDNFPRACLGCKNKAVGGFMCLEIFQKSIWTASGEPLARSFDKKMVFNRNPTFSFLAPILKLHFGVFLEGGGVIISKNHQN